ATPGHRQGDPAGYAVSGGGHRVAWTHDRAVTLLAAIVARVRVRAVTRDRGVVPPSIEWYRVELRAVLDRFVTQRRPLCRDGPRVIHLC
ncbi:MAG: hypothetical protein ACRDQX_16650, partial [Pseudonocardiaceae bacterium]